MSRIIDDLKALLSEAQGRLQQSQQKLTEAQKEHDAAIKEFSTWQAALELATRKSDDATGIASAPTPMSSMDESGESSGVSKAELIRNVLRQNPGGITPALIWKAVQDKIRYRPYVYSVLNRLKEKNRVAVRRGKYYLLPNKEQEDRAESVVQ